MTRQNGVAYGAPGFDITLLADADLSAKQYYFVALDADGKASVDEGANAVTIGILQDKPSAEDQHCRVRVGGVSLLKVNESCNEGAKLTTTATGLGEVCDADLEFCGAIALEAAAAQNDYIVVLVTHFQHGQ